MPTDTKIGGDTWVIDQMAEMVRRHNPTRETAKLYSFMWLTILAEMDGTVMSDVLDRFTRSAPSRHDQQTIVRKLRGALGDRSPLGPPRPRLLA